MKKIDKSTTRKAVQKNIEMNKCLSSHPDYSHLIPNINRISGQIEGIKKMIIEKRYCPDIVQQMKSAKSALNSVEAILLESHMDSCVMDAFNSKDEKEKSKKIDELKILYRRFNN